MVAMQTAVVVSTIRLIKTFICIIFNFTSGIQALFLVLNVKFSYFSNIRQISNANKTLFGTTSVHKEMRQEIVPWSFVTKFCYGFQHKKAYNTQHLKMNMNCIWH